jgi:hypothetical protein
VATLREQLGAWAHDHETELIFFDPPEYFDDAILGLVTGYGQEAAVVYDEAKVIAALAVDMGEDDAREWYEFNTIGAYLGEATPRFLIRLSEVIDVEKT